jgi:ATP-binding cassette subfamily F protein 3
VWVEKYLQTFPGTVLFVSHDRDLLNRLARNILHLNQGKLSAYKGNYDAFLEAFALLQSQEVKEKAQIESQKKQLETFITRFGAKATKAKQAQAKMKVIDRLDAQAAQLGSSKIASGISFSLPTPTPVDRIVCRIEQGSIGYQKPLHSAINLQIERGQKVAVIGSNGIGKSTLLKTLTGLIPALGGSFTKSLRCELSYFSQNQLDELSAEKTALENVLDKSSISEKEARQILGAFLFKGNDVFKPTKVLSGGEKSRLGLAIILAKQANFLVLDEPTNHLDLASCACLTKALQEYKGTAIFVSHDRSFINEVCSHVFVMTSDGRSMLFAGTIEDYLRLAAHANFPNVLEPVPLPATAKEGAKAPSPKENREQRSRELKKKRDALEKSLAKLEGEIAALQGELTVLDTAMADPKNSMDFTLLGELQQKRTPLQAELERKEGAWLEGDEARSEVVRELQELGRG